MIQVWLVKMFKAGNLVKSHLEPPSSLEPPSLQRDRSGSTKRALKLQAGRQRLNLISVLGRFD